ncbi:2046_t:CDS:1 [Ambispora gerdemannii]|uniref:2046_t:CDS:1 n=1 Tax=Ambispora gerdemannii TaxID=144530 RepID=A0A9N9GX86_9GLOM|nr:2046_t:CDS:1 [Ambispora gerdemannii]
MPPSLQNELFSKWSSAFDSARHKLLAIKRQEGFEEVKRKGITIDKEVSRRLYLEFCEGEPKVSVNHRLIDGKIEAYEMPLDPHSAVQGELTYIIRSWSSRLRVHGEMDIIVGTRSVYRPDICVRPLNRHQPQSLRAVNSSGNPYPTLVVEIGNTESLNSLHELAEKYFSQRTTIQIYLAIKLYPPRRNNTFALLAVLYLRNNQNPTTPVVVKSFGTAPLSNHSRIYLQSIVRDEFITGVGFGGAPCAGADIGKYQLAIPTNLLFNDVPGGVPGDVPNNFIVNLWSLQDAILNN